jgi:catechol 2,3-dioxygenase-like lactoylglutathione lyase family enzyme
MSKKSLGITRRRFLESASMALPLAMIHAHPVTVAGDQPPVSPKSDHTAERSITKLRLLGRKLEEQRQFYSQVLGLPIVEDSANAITVQAGPSKIAFVDEKPEYQNPFYHFCFLIPENKLESARLWLAKRWPVITVHGQQVIHFREWNAHSIYFLDPAGNIVEFIAHHDLKNGRSGDFTTDDILHVNEIGVVVDDVSKTVVAMKERMGIGPFTRASNVFADVGTREGSFIVVKKDRLWFPERRSPAIVCPTIATIRAPQSSRLVIDGCPYDLSVGPAA